jgi:hypothetical protein
MSGTQGAPDNVRCAVALNDDSITMAPIIRIIFIMNGSSRVQGYQPCDGLKIS